MRFSFLAPLAILAVAVSAIPMSIPTKSTILNANSNDVAVKFDKRGPASWIIGDFIDPALKDMEPAMRASWENVIRAAKVSIVAALPDSINESVAQVFGLTPIASNIIKCPGILQPLCKAVFLPIDKITDAIKLTVKKSIDISLDMLVYTLNDITMVRMKIRFLLEQDKVRNHEWGFSDWLKERLDQFIRDLKADVKAPVHDAVETATKAMLSVAPAESKDKLGAFLPDGTVVNNEESVVGDLIRDKVNALYKAVFGLVHTKIESAMAELEANIMASFDEIVRKALVAMAAKDNGKH